MTQLLCHTAREGHPFRKFGWGNKISLWEQPRAAGVDLHASLSAFYRRYYGAQSIRLVVCGEETLDEQDAAVRAKFGAVMRAPEDPPSFAAAGPPFEGASGRLQRGTGGAGREGRGSSAGCAAGRPRV